MSKLAQRIKDKRVLYYIRQMLKAGMMVKRKTLEKAQKNTRRVSASVLF
ncbi:MAG: hypothetical protein IKA23_05670 [Akkermansia sp.]|nr:hypothetical protein [Akkermansia sp.]MBR2313546.1 hypothetical protein [Akkermansia sp.]